MIGQEVDFLFREWLKHSHGNTNQYIQKVVFLGTFHRVSGFHLKHSRRCVKLQKVSVWQSLGLCPAVERCFRGTPRSSWRMPRVPGQMNWSAGLALGAQGMCRGCRLLSGDTARLCLGGAGRAPAALSSLQHGKNQGCVSGWPGGETTPSMRNCPAGSTQSSHTDPSVGTSVYSQEIRVNLGVLDTLMLLFQGFFFFLEMKCGL